MSLPTGVAKRGSNYHLQIKVPARLRPIIKRDFWVRKSLECADKPTAAALAHRHWAEATAAFAAAEAQLKPRQPVALTAALKEYIVKKAEHFPLAVDQVVRYEPGAVVEWLRYLYVPPIRFLTSDDDPPFPEPEYLKPSPDGSLTPSQVERLREIAQRSIDDLGLQMSIGRLDFAKGFADSCCKSIGVEVDWTDSSNRMALVEVLRALLVGWIGAHDRGHGKPVATPPTPEYPLTAPSLTKTPKAKSLQDAFDEWKAGKKRDAINKTTRALALLKAAGVNAPLRGLTRQDAIQFRDYLNATMAHAAGKTRSNVLASVQALLNFAVKEKGWIEANPWAGTAIPKGRAKKRITWDDSELQTLLTAPIKDDRRVDADAQFWLPVLALLTGARQAELCQLDVDDVMQRDGFWLLDINEEGEDKSVKSAAGERCVAIHSKLIELGFIDHVQRMRAAGASLVFPGILRSPSRTASLYASDWFRDRCKTLGIYRRWRDFHSFRTTVGTALRAVDPPLGEALILAVMGHEGGTVGTANYHQPLPRTLQRVIETLRFPALDAVAPPSPRAAS